MTRLPRWLNCGTVLAMAGVLVFALLTVVLVQILCHGPGGIADQPMLERMRP